MDSIKQWWKSPLLQQVKSVLDLQSTLDNLTRDELVGLWRLIHKRTPPKHLYVSLLKRSIIYEWQSIKYGAVSRTVITDIRGIITTNITITQKVIIDTQLMREWRGKTYKVNATEGGYIYNDKVYKSLSAIAKYITGTEYSGYRFFGLKKVNLKRLEHKAQSEFRGVV